MGEPARGPETDRIAALFARQRAHQAAVKRSTAANRVARLRRLRDAITSREGAIREALAQDFRKAPAESDLTEIVPVLVELEQAIAHLKLPRLRAQTHTPRPMDAAQLAQLSKTLLRRAMISSLQQTNTTDAERATLAAAPRPITGPHAQDYAAWRRAVLWVSGLVLAIGLIIELAGHKEMAVSMDPQVAAAIGKDNLELLDNLQYCHLFIKMVVVALVLFAARAWSRVTRSRHLARWAWVTALVVPLGIAAWPWATSLSLEHLGAHGDQVRKYFALALAVFYLVILAPKLLSIFPGIMRSALTMKTLFPESMQTGWMTVLTAPLFTGFLLLALCVLSQMQGSFIVIGAFVCLAVGPCIYLQRARDLMSPHPLEDADRIVRQIRRRALAFNTVGIVLLVVYLVAKDVVPVHTALQMMLEAFGGVLLTMVAFSDLLLALLKFELRQSAAFAGSALEKSYHTRLEELDQTGLTDLAGALRLREQKTTPAS